MFSIRGSPFPYGDYRTEMGRETRIFPYGESPFPNRVCFHLGINIYKKVAGKSPITRTKATLDGIVTPAGINFPVPSPWRKADLPKICIEFPHKIPSLEYSVSLFAICFGSRRNRLRC